MPKAPRVAIFAAFASFGCLAKKPIKPRPRFLSFSFLAFSASGFTTASAFVSPSEFSGSPSPAACLLAAFAASPKLPPAATTAAAAATAASCELSPLDSGVSAAGVASPALSPSVFLPPSATTAATGVAFAPSALAVAASFSRFAFNASSNFCKSAGFVQSRVSIPFSILRPAALPTRIISAQK